VLGVFGLILLAGVFAVGSAVFSPVEVQVATAREGEAMATVYATGHVEARERRVIRAQRAAVVHEWFTNPRTTKPFIEGDEVHAGEAILRLRETSLAVRQEAAAAELKRVSEQLEPRSPYRRVLESQIVEAEGVAKDDRAREGRLKQQLAAGNVSQDTYDQARTRAESSEQRLAQLSQQYAQVMDDLAAALSRARADLETLKAAEQDDIIRAPMDGVILRLPVKPGEFAVLGTELLKVGDLRELIIEAEVNEDDIGNVQLERSVNIRLAGFDSLLIKGSVYEILPDADRSTKGYTVRVNFTNARLIEGLRGPLSGRVELEGEVRPLSGMTAELGIVVDRKLKAITFPRPALTPNNTVFVVKDGHTVETRVQLGLINFSTCEAVSGLAAGDVVVVSDTRSLSDGTRVRVKETSSTSAR
jgi:RND family efflux transporter MFP subunit